MGAHFMIYKQNLHTHTTYTDGKDTPEELVLEAIKRGFSSIGFSEHSFMHFSDFQSQLKIENMAAYINEINKLKEKHQDMIDIFCGLEYELFSEVPTSNLDYMIGSVHYLKFGEKLLGFDRNLAQTQDYINDNFGGDGLKFAKKYFETVITLPQKHNFDIIGHFDLIAKNNEKGRFIDTSSKEYLNAGFEAIHSLKGKIPLFEVNTGAISRGYRTSPYPQPEFLKEFKNCGFGAVITSDCHNKNFLDCYFKEARELLISTGFKTIWILTNDGFKEVSL